MRDSIDKTYINIALEFSKRSTCSRRSVGAIIVDQHGYILSAGYNGQSSGMPHCIDHKCSGADSKSGHNIDACEAVHAEQNAIARLKEPFNAWKIYCTTAPCISCTKLILATSIQEVIFLEDYIFSGKDLFLKSGKNWNQFINV